MLAAFPGGAGLDALESMVRDEEIDVFEQVEALVDASLVTAEETLEGDPRFKTLNTIHSFATDELHRLGEHASTHVSAVGWVLGWIDPLSAGFDGAEKARLDSAMEVEYENLRHLIGWLLAENASRADGFEPTAAALELVVLVVDRFATPRGFFAEATSWVTTILDRSTGRLDVRVANVMGCLAELRRHSGDYFECNRTHCRRRRPSHHAVGAVAHRPSYEADRTRHSSGTRNAAHGPRRLEGARDDFEAASADELDPRHRMNLMLQMAIVEAAEGQASEALELELAALEIAKTHGFHEVQARALHNSACSLRELGRLGEAERQMRENLPAHVRSSEHPHFHAVGLARTTHW